MSQTPSHPDHPDQNAPVSPEEALAAEAANQADASAALTQEVSNLKAQNADLADQFLRAKAEAENARRRAEEEVSKARKFAVESFAESLLAVADSLEAGLSIQEATREQLREGSEATLKQLQSAHGASVAMVGDGINDAPALKQANVGIAIGAGADVAIEAADVTLVQGELTKLVEAILLSRATFRKIVQNLFWAWFYNIAVIPIAAVGLLHPMVGVIAMTASSLSVIGNSILLKRAHISASELR